MGVGEETAPPTPIHPRTHTASLVCSPPAEGIRRPRSREVTVMATHAGETSTDYITGRLQEMEKENAQLKRELQALRAERDVARGTAQSAMAERVAAQDLTGRLVAEERATQQVLAEQGSNFTYVN